jgi:hypothetical protein
MIGLRAGAVAGHHAAATTPMKHLPHLLLVAATASATLPAPGQSIILATDGVAHSEDFNTLSTTAGSTTNSLLPTGWFIAEGGGGARDNEQYAVDSGASTTGDTYSYGAAGTFDRALGGLQSGTLIPRFGVALLNNMAGTIASLDIGYTGEHWRVGTSGRADRLDFQFSLDASDLTTGTWTDFDALDFTSSARAATGALDGNQAANRTLLSASLSGLSVGQGTTLWLRWSDQNATGADDGLAIDDFSVTPRAAIPEPSTYAALLAALCLGVAAWRRRP